MVSTEQTKLKIDRLTPLPAIFIEHSWSSNRDGST